MKKVKQIAAIVCIVFLVGLYILTLIAGILATPQVNGLFWACIFCTVAVPCMLWAIGLVYRLLKGKGQEDIREETEK